MIEHTLPGRALRAGFVSAGLFLALGIPAATLLALVASHAPPSTGPGGFALAALDFALAACRLGLLLAGAATTAAVAVMCVPERFLCR